MLHKKIVLIDLYEPLKNYTNWKTYFSAENLTFLNKKDDEQKTINLKQYTPKREHRFWLPSSQLG